MIKILSEIASSGSERNLAIRVSNQAEGKIRQHHPWIFDNSITSISHPGKPGDLAIIFDKKHKFLAIGLWDPFSPIRIRLLHYQQPVNIDQNWFTSKITSSIAKRSSIDKISTTGYRLIHGENDGLPGLVVDRYDKILVIKIYSLAWAPHLEKIITSLQEIIPYKSIVLRLSRKIESEMKERFQLMDGLILDGDEFPTPVLFKENKLIFEANPVLGHKTGFYLDQRENRAKVMQLANRKDVLNVFSYNGGFSVYAAAGGAKSVTSVDINPFAIESAIRNFHHNFYDDEILKEIHKTVVEDAFTYLDRSAKEGKYFGMVILDPPMFAQNANQVPQAIKNYKKLTRLALNLIEPKGILVQASCSSRISSSVFFEEVFNEISKTGRTAVDVIRTSHPIDHPIGFPEGEYLKCLFTTII
jgi:23S rRNA (cytosine1962-C5)-methyltransferase